MNTLPRWHPSHACAFECSSSRSNVHLLRVGSCRTTHEKIPVVEKISNFASNGTIRYHGSLRNNHR
ncbi:hypothetical protein X975_12352, partial [Stegodyphus mimosarum]